jgi:hypothetical protein
MPLSALRKKPVKIFRLRTQIFPAAYFSAQFSPVSLTGKIYKIYRKLRRMLDDGKVVAGRQKQSLEKSHAMG